MQNCFLKSRRAGFFDFKSINASVDTEVVYMSSKILLLAVGGLSQAEKKVTLVTS
jgi:hypothetical protein